MILQNYYYYFPKAFTPRFCDDIVKEGLSKQELAGQIGAAKKMLEESDNPEQTKKDLLKLRDSNVQWLNDPWIYNQLTPFVHQANQEAGWNFNIDYFEDLQFTMYKKTQHYSWHSDQFAKPIESPDTNFNGKIRKLSAIVLLNDPEEYEGGVLEFQYRDTPEVKTFPCERLVSKGDLIVFPSFVWHRVTPVTSGTRYSLVAWGLGYPFK